MTMRERIVQGQLFTDECEGLPEERRRAKTLMKEFNDTFPSEMNERIRLLKKIFGQNPEFWIEPPFYFCYGTHITIGKGSYINVNCSFIDDGMITIGEKVMIGPAVTIATVGHPIDPLLREKGYMYADPVVLSDNCWIGANVVICPGVHIGRNSVIGAGSVVTKDIPDNVVAAGNPCNVIREIGEQDRKYYYKDREVMPEDLI